MSLPFTRRLFGSLNNPFQTCIGTFNAIHKGPSVFQRCSSVFQTVQVANVFFFGTKALFKTNQAAAKRLRVRGSGSIKRWVVIIFNWYGKEIYSTYWILRNILSSMVKYVAFHLTLHKILSLTFSGFSPTNRPKAGRQHNTGYKSRGRCNRLGQSSGISEPGIEKRMRRAIGK